MFELATTIANFTVCIRVFVSVWVPRAGSGSCRVGLIRFLALGAVE